MVLFWEILGVCMCAWESYAFKEEHLASLEWEELRVSSDIK